MDSVIGSRFGKWLIIGDADKDAKSNRLALCQCECGTQKIQRLSTLQSSNSTQCKKCRMDEFNKITDIIGQKFGSSTVISRLENNNRKEAQYLVRCDCGSERKVLGYRLKALASTKCPRCRVKTHGKSYSSIFRIWSGLFRRCYNKNFKAYKYYGGRGITVCERWFKFENFYEDMGNRPIGESIDRINNDGNYEPGNCRWATALVQRQNQRKNKENSL